MVSLDIENAVLLLFSLNPFLRLHMLTQHCQHMTLVFIQTSLFPEKLVDVFKAEI